MPKADTWQLHQDHWPIGKTISRATLSLGTNLEKKTYLSKAVLYVSEVRKVESKDENFASSFCSQCTETGGKMKAKTSWSFKKRKEILLLNNMMFNKLAN